MGRRRNGLNISAWLLIDKPAGITSAAAVNRLSWLLNAKKAGHAGTLDPDATGLLPIAFGEATKTLSLLTEAQKTYEFTLRFGAETNTDDASGVIIEESEIIPSETELRAILPQFTGEIMQIPPQYSAVKINGVRAYKRARMGESFTIKAKPLWVSRLDLLSYAPPFASLAMRCGKGGYVRAIARDLGRALGSLAHVRELRRVAIDPFTIKDAVGYDALQEDEENAAENISQALLPLDAAVKDFCKLEVTGADALRISNGNPVHLTKTQPSGTICAYHQGTLLAFGQEKGGMFCPTRVLNP